MTKTDLLREACREEYGDEFVKEYDALQEGVPVGDFFYTVGFLDKVEAVKKRLRKRGLIGRFRRGD